MKTQPDTYCNPLWNDYFADPFVWQHDGVYYAIGTGAAEASGHGQDAGMCCIFPLLRSDELAQWHFVGHALKRPDASLGGTFWAPEVAYDNGVFHLYYSVGKGDQGHHLRVAMSHQPEGPYEDAGISLTDRQSCLFAIDPNPFRDEDGRWYLFYAQDFLDVDEAAGVHAGTALVAAPMQSMTLLGEPVVVMRSHHPWQRYLRDRLMYGRRFDWHTLEGPCVRKHEGRYYCFYSGGRWESESYGVDYGEADHVMGPYQDTGLPDAPRVLRTVPDVAMGPGHNSIIRGPDGSTDYMVYHAWDREMRARRMCMDRLEWLSEGPRCRGPTVTPQPLGESVPQIPVEGKPWNMPGPGRPLSSV